MKSRAKYANEFRGSLIGAAIMYRFVAPFLWILAAVGSFLWLPISSLAAQRAAVSSFAMGAAAPSMTPQQINDLTRAAVVRAAVPVIQPLAPQTVANPGSAANVLTFTPRNVGLIRSFIIEVTGVLHNADANAAALSDFGLMNLLSNVTYTDLNNYQRINTSGIHLAAVATAKQKYPFFGADLTTGFTTGAGFGDNWGSILAPANIAAAGNGNFSYFYEVPIAYSDEDLRGAIFANVIQAQQSLQVTINPAPGATTATDSTFKVYKGLVSGANLTFTSVTVTVYQKYYDQLPISKGQYLLPQIDLATIYELKNTTIAPLTSGVDNPYQYGNLRQFLSTFALYNSNGTTDAGRANPGSLINYLAIQSANTTNLRKVDPFLQACESRKRIFTDWPNSMYYFDTRHKPISSQQYGNMQLIVNPITAGAGNYLNILVEDFAQTATLSAAGSLAGS